MGLSIVQSATMPELEEYITIQEAVEDPRVPYTAYWLRRLAQEGKVEAVKIGARIRGNWLIHLPSLLEYIDEMKDLGTKKHSPWD